MLAASVMPVVLPSGMVLCSGVSNLMPPAVDVMPGSVGVSEWQATQRCAMRPPEEMRRGR